MAGGGIVEGALIGAALGGGSAAVQGQDPLKGALMGAATGGAGAGIGGALFGSGAGAAGGAEAGAAGGAGGGGAAPIINGAVPGGSAAGVPYTPNMLSVADAGAGPMSTVPGMNQPLGAQVGAGPMSSASAPVAQSAGMGMPQAPGGPISDTKEWWKGLSTPEKALYGGGAGIGALMAADRNKYKVPKEEKYSGPLSKFRYDPANYTPRFYAEGGIAGLNQSISVGGDPRRNPPPIDINVPGPSDWQGGEQRMAAGGSTLGGYSDGGRLLKGPGDGMSDNIPAKIGHKQPARLAEGEFVVPADVVSHLGNGSTDAGAKQLYRMMDKVRHARTGNPHQGKQINPRKYMPA
jgi:hypothetical protein